ncbi:hypothetical protein UVI_02011190 [Ustilaginoidea virens]|uniref:Uncharacterized protein n=1 Tax=Ustilaginoidea virens TaxID=1159556 RepID=A0A1B5L233_USTVR|nr:hypothetical protein UVI_02011190 [Ustilaginoidea virens]
MAEWGIFPAMSIRRNQGAAPSTTGGGQGAHTDGILGAGKAGIDSGTRRVQEERWRGDDEGCGDVESCGYDVEAEGGELSRDRAGTVATASKMIGQYAERGDDDAVGTGVDAGGQAEAGAAVGAAVGNAELLGDDDDDDEGECWQEGATCSCGCGCGCSCSGGFPPKRTAVVDPGDASDGVADAAAPGPANEPSPGDDGNGSAAGQEDTASSLPGAGDDEQLLLRRIRSSSEGRALSRGRSPGCIHREMLRVEETVKVLVGAWIVLATRVEVDRALEGIPHKNASFVAGRQNKAG